MAFTESQKLKIVKIIGNGLNIISLNYILDQNSVYVTAEVQTQVATELTRWDTYGSKFVRLNSTESNFGVETNSSDAKADIRKNIAALLFLNDYVSASSAQGVIIRG